MENNGRGLEEVPCVQTSVTEEVKAGAVKRVRPGLGDGVQNRTRIPPVLGIDRVGNHVDFSDCVRARIHDRRIEGQVVGVNAVDQKIVLVGLAAVGGEIAAPVGSGHHSRQRLLKLDPVPTVQRHVHDLIGADGRPKLNTCPFNLDRRGFYGNLLGQLTDFHLDVEHVNLVHTDAYCMCFEQLETFHLGLDGVGRRGR